MKKNMVRACFGLGLASIVAFSVTAQAEGIFGITADKIIPDALKPSLHKLFPETAGRLFERKDEAKLAEEAGNLSAQQKQILFAGASDDYFKDMDYGITKNPTEAQRRLSAYVPGITPQQAVERMARGRNNWIVWTFGNDKFWSDLGRATLGGLDFIKTMSSHPNLPSERANRWQTLGLVNEPCFTQANGPRADRFGLYLDQRVISADCPADPFEDETKYPGVKIGSRGKTLKFKDATGKAREIKMPVGSMYGYATGIVGLRLFPNPEFDEKAASKWDPVRYYNDPNYFNDPKLVRPFRVGMSCAFCHVGPNPSNPPADFNNPAWANLNSNPGAQYFWFDRVFTWNWRQTKAAKYPSSEDSFVFQFVHSFRPGALDTSLVSSDQINNARTMNAVYDLRARLNTAIKFNQTEILKGDETLTAQFRKMPTNMLPEASPLRGTSKDQQGSELVVAPRILKDGADSVGALGALNRVYVNIGLFSEEWVTHFIPLIGGASLTPFPVRKAQENSIYWQANVQQTPDLALFFLGSAQPDKLETAPGGEAYLKDINSPEVSLGKKVFAENCAACHSTKIPEKGYSFFKNECHGKNYLQCWDKYWSYTQTNEFKSEMTKIVEQKDFLQDNFLSNDMRVPVTLTDSQLCSPIATNGLKGDIWDNFSSSTYKDLPSVGRFVVNYPTDHTTKMKSESILVPDGGRGFLRPPSLISVWSSAPFLQNNTLGKFDGRGTVDGRMSSFNDSIHKLLYPEERANPVAPQLSGMDTKAVYYKTNLGYTLPGVVDVTDRPSFVKIPKAYVPKYLQAIIDTTIRLNPFAKKNFIKKGFEYVSFPGDEQSKVAKKDKKNKKDLKNVRDVAAEEYGWSAEDDPKKMGEEYRLGPIPAGVPVNLIVNLNLTSDPINQAKLGLAITSLVQGILASKDKPPAEALEIFMEKAASSLVAVSKCSDFVVNRGHYFGTQYDPRLVGQPDPKGLSAEEKTALIEYIKHF
jgi:hypothetical protein